MKINKHLRDYSLLIAVAITGLLPNPAIGELEINSLSQDGKLTWSDPGGTGTHYAVQWSDNGLTNWCSWQDAQKRLSGLGATGSVNVPMFYRMVTPDPTYNQTASYSYVQTLEGFNPLTPLETNEMRITFMGSMIPLPVRRAQAEMSIFVEVGWKANTNDTVYKGRALDQFIFDCGAGVSANYAAAMVGFRRMDKVFINHLHGDHMSDLAHIYCFGPAGDRKSPLYVFGQSKSDVTTPGSGVKYDDGVSNFCAAARAAWRWHSESFSFQPSAYTNYLVPTKASWGLPHDPLPVGDDPADDAFAMIPITLDWRTIGGVAYDNKATGAKVTHYPVIHCRQGSLGFKLAWTPPGSTKPLTMMYSSDTKPETNSVNQAINGGDGVDVYIHEMVVPPEVWAYKNMGLNAPPPSTSPVYTNYLATVEQLKAVQDSSHTPQGAFGYMLTQITPKPRLVVATHFPVADDTVSSAYQSVKNHCPTIEMGKDIIWSFDLMVLRVFPDRIEQRRAVVSDYAFNPPVQLDGGFKLPKYNNGTAGDPYLQIDLSTSLSRTNENGSENWRADGY